MTPFDHDHTNSSPEQSGLSFRLEQKDMLDFYNLTIRYRSQSTLFGRFISDKYAPWIAGVALFFIGVLIVRYFQINVTSSFWFYTSLLFLILILIMASAIANQGAALMPHEDGVLLGKRLIEVEEDGFVMSQDGIQSAYMWKSVGEVVETDTTIYLFVDANMAHIFPKAVFPSPIQAQEFAAFCRERVSLSRAGSSAGSSTGDFS